MAVWTLRMLANIQFRIFCLTVSYPKTQRLKIKMYTTIILPAVFYGWKIWSLKMREECRLRVFENRVLRRTFGSEKDEVTGEWWRLHNEKLHDLYCSPNVIRVIKSRRMRLAGHVGRVRRIVLMKKHKENRPLEEQSLVGRIIWKGILR